MKRIFSLLILLSFIGIAIAQPQYHKDYNELSNPKKTNANAWVKVARPLYASFVSKDVRFAKEIVPNLPREVNFWGETGWRGERLSAQLLLWSGVGVNEVKVRISDLETSKGDKISAENLTVGFVRYVMSDTYGKDGCSPRRTRDFDSTLVADVIELKSSVNIKAKTVQPVWLTFNIPAEAQSGKYKGFVTITAKGLTAPITFTANVFVREHILPSVANWSFDLDMWQNPYAVAHYHNVAPWSKAHLDAMRPVMELLAQSGQKNITVPITNGVFEDPSLSDFESMLTLTKRVDDSWSIDFTKFDMWVEFMLQLGISKEITCYVGSAQVQNMSYFDQASNSVKTADLQFDSKEYSEYLKVTLGLLVDHLKEKGWMDKTRICIKESGKERLRRVISTTIKVDSTMQLCYLGNYFPDTEANVARYSISQSLPVAAKQTTIRTEAGRELCFYQPCGDVHPNTYIFSPAAEAAWIGWYAAANGFDGYTRQHYNSWGKRPLQDVRSPRRPAGYTVLAYPDGRTSIRLERLVEGIQDFEKIKILQQKFEQTGNVVQREKLQKMLKTITLENIKTRPSGELIDEARIMLNSL